MRLIDADRLRAKITAMVTRPHQFMYEIERAPTVEAITVEWIEKKLNCCDNINAEIFVKALIRDWRKENGRS